MLFYVLNINTVIPASVSALVPVMFRVLLSSSALMRCSNHWSVLQLDSPVPETAEEAVESPERSSTSPAQNLPAQAGQQPGLQGPPELGFFQSDPFTDRGSPQATPRVTSQLSNDGVIRTSMGQPVNPIQP